MIKEVDNIIESVLLVKRFARKLNDVTYDQLIVLLCVYEYRSINAKDIAQRLLVSEKQSTKWKKLLIESGYLIDSYTITLSDKGIELCKEFRRFVLLSSPI